MAYRAIQRTKDSAENCARPQKLSHARVTIDLFSTFLTHWNVRTQISNGCFYHFGLTDKILSSKTITPECGNFAFQHSIKLEWTGLNWSELNRFWIQNLFRKKIYWDRIGERLDLYCWYRDVSTTNKESLLLQTFYSKACMCNDYSPAIEWLKA